MQIKYQVGDFVVTRNRKIIKWYKIVDILPKRFKVIEILKRDIQTDPNLKETSYIIDDECCKGKRFVYIKKSNPNPAKYTPQKNLRIVEKELEDYISINIKGSY